jgi:hypothetical protein
VSANSTQPSRFSQEAMEAPLPSRSKRTGRKPARLEVPFISAIPLQVVVEVEAKRAGNALGLVLALHRMMVMKEEAPSLAITDEVWGQLGKIDPSRRQVMLRNLKKVPKVFKLTSSKSYHHHYKATRGPLWPKG